MTKFYPIKVTRNDAGGPLWAPGYQLNGMEVENGEVPSHDHGVIHRRCNELNGVPVKTQKKRSASDLFDALLQSTSDADKLRKFAQSLAGRMDNESIEDLFGEELRALDYTHEQTRAR